MKLRATLITALAFALVFVSIPTYADGNKDVEPITLTNTDVEFELSPKGLGLIAGGLGTIGVTAGYVAVEMAAKGAGQSSKPLTKTTKLVGLAGLGATAYLLYKGIDEMIDVKEEKIILIPVKDVETGRKILEEQKSQDSDSVQYLDSVKTKIKMDTHYYITPSPSAI